MTLPPLPLRTIRLAAPLIVIALVACTASANETDVTNGVHPDIIDAQIGFLGAYKLGCWTPLAIEIHGGAQHWSGQVRVEVPDTDGVPTHVTRSIQVDQGSQQLVRLHVRVGQASSPIGVALLSEDGTTQAMRRFYLGSRVSQAAPGGYPATNRLVLEVGGNVGVDKLLQADETSNEQLATRIARIDDAADLPTKWYGYESVETILLSTSNVDLYRPLTETPDRLDALDEWVQRGGQLILFCGSSAEELIADDGVLRRFAPGQLQGMERLTQPEPLAVFSGSEQVGKIRRLNLSVPNLVDVSGQILASAGRSATSVPLVVRMRRGFGEVVFVGLDFDQPPLNDWEGSISFLRRLLQWQSTDTSRQADQQRDATDLTNHLRNSLDQKFVGVSVIPFGLVAFLAGAYILLIGPGDYFFVRRVLNRPALTWLTFPLLVIGISILAYAIVDRMKGNQFRVNQVEIIDVDCTSEAPSRGFARGTVYTHLFVPEVSSLDLTLQTNYLGRDIGESTDSLVSWFGLPGFSLGAMQASGSQTVVFEDGYSFADDLSSMQMLPVQVWSTKTLAARWSATVEPQVQIKLRPDGEELIQGTITNESDVALDDCALLYNRWAYRIGTIPAGKSVEINDSMQPRTVRTLLTSATAGDERATRTSEDGTVPFIGVQWDVARLLKVMMFYKALNGEKYTNMLQRYQPFLDLSDALQFDDQAILIARCENTASQWQAQGKPLASDQDRSWTYYRFVTEVEEANPQNN